MATRPVLLLDDGGVMNDNRLRRAQWQQRVGEFFVPLLGGTLAAWAEANRIVVTHLFEPANWQARVRSAPDYASFEHAYWLDWLAGMCRLVGITPPPAEECVELAEQAEAYITRRVRTAFPGAVEAIRELYARGYTLHTASGESSATLQGYLEGMGVRECFGRLYGPDLLNTLKETPAYYERLFADAQLTPGNVLVVDDSPRVLAWAREQGATTVLVSAGRQQALEGALWVNSLAELPELMLRLCL